MQKLPLLAILFKQKNTLLKSRVFFLLRHLPQSCADNQKANAEKHEIHN
jgi:hypothetical protein